MRQATTTALLLFLCFSGSFEQVAQARELRNSKGNDAAFERSGVYFSGLERNPDDPNSDEEAEGSLFGGPPVKGGGAEDGDDNGDQEPPKKFKRLSLGKALMYAPPSLTTVPVTVMISVYGVQFYETLGAPLGMLAFFQALARSFDVITDPTMSYITDSHRSKEGRRRPFMWRGAPLYCIMLIGLFLPWPGLSGSMTALWFGLFYIGFFWLSTFVNIPYDALAPELTDHPDDRSRLFFVCTLFDGLGAIAAVLAPALSIMMIAKARDSPKKYESCNNPDTDSSCTGTYCIHPRSGSGAWIVGRISAPESARDWIQVVTSNATTLATLDRGSDCAADDKGAVQGNQTLVEQAAAGNWANSTTYQALLDVAQWCRCLNLADNVFSVDNQRYGYLVSGGFFGLWAWISLWNVVKQFKEQPVHNLPDPEPLVSSVLQAFNNRPFVSLLPAWVLDSLATTMISSLLVFYVRYIIKPEYTNQDTWGCRPVGGSDDWKCSTTMVMAASILAFLAGALFFTPVWFLLQKYLGKVKTWLLWSFVNGVTFLAYAPLGPGMVYECIAMSVVNGIPVGAKFLADAIVSDTIDYDEFLTGSRSEATYMMFRGFLPKIAAIPASAIPIALMDVVGHIKPVDGVPKEQPQSVRTFIQIAIIYLPSIFALLAFCLKLSYKLNTDKKVRMITAGIMKHKAGEPAEDPMSGNMFMPEVFEEESEVEAHKILGAFPGVEVVQKIAEDNEAGCAKLMTKARTELMASMLCFFASIGITGGTFKYLLSEDPADEQLKAIPVFFTVISGVGMTSTFLTTLRYRSALAIQEKQTGDDPISGKVFEKILREREGLAALR